MGGKGDVLCWCCGAGCGMWLSGAAAVVEGGSFVGARYEYSTCCMLAVCWLYAGCMDDDDAKSPSRQRARLSPAAAAFHIHPAQKKMPLHIPYPPRDGAFVLSPSPPNLGRANQQLERERVLPSFLFSLHIRSTVVPTPRSSGHTAPCIVLS